MVAIVFLFLVFAVILLTLASRISLRPEYQCEVAAHEVGAQGATWQTLVNAISTHVLILGPLLFFHYLVPQKSFAILVILFMALAQKRLRSFASIPMCPLAGQLYLNVPVLLFILGLGLQGRSSCRLSYTVPGI